MGYTEKECNKQIDMVKGSMNELYKSSFITRKGQLKDENISYLDYFSKVIHNKFLICDKISGENLLVDIEKSKMEYYFKYARQEKEGTGEEKIQREYSNGTRKLDSKYGKYIWHEMAIYSNGKGIDLIYYNEEENVLNIIELKYKSSENLLKPILEIQTYYQMVYWEKAIKELIDKGLISNANPKINKFIMIDKDSDMHKMYMNINEHEYLNELINKFKIGIIIYSE